jgi:hypothetical protein
MACILTFDIPIRYNNEVRQDIMQTGQRSSTKIGVQIDVKLLSLQAIERIDYCMPDFSSLKIEALRQHSLDVPRVRGMRHSTIWMWYVVYDMRVIFIYSYYYMSAS